MKKILLLLTSSLAMHAMAQKTIVLPQAKFNTGDNTEWKTTGFNDSKWVTLKTDIAWEAQGYQDYNGYAWYRIHFILPSSLKKNAFSKDSLKVFLGKADDACAAYFNGKLIGKTGSMPDDAGGYLGAWNITSEFHLAANDPSLKWDGDNVLAVRVYDGGGGGGLYSATPFIAMLELIDAVQIQLDAASKSNTITLTNNGGKPVPGSLSMNILNAETGKNISTSTKAITLSPGKTETIETANPDGRIYVKAIFTEQQSKLSTSSIKSVPYILTPAPPAQPRINGAAVFGARPGSPVLYKIAATGVKPLQYAVENLPAGLKLDAEKGIISGALTREGDYQMKLVVTNAKGKEEKPFTIKVGKLLALTPPMGWNSWNCWGLSVNMQRVESSAQALIDKGLIDHGWSYINIDDGWEQPKRDANGNVVPNSKFPDMKGLGDWLHARGLKFGIYSSPGPLTCGGFLGSYQHEINDANSYANWGIDYLKYDWCSYDNIAGKDTSMAAYQKPYLVMRDALRMQDRDIVYSLCQYGMKNVWEWGDAVDGNCWRTTGDINDSWASLRTIGFSQTVQHAFAQPGRWNDPDMLIVGQVGWGDNLHPTRLTPDEQYTHISLWCLLSAPLLIGCDISRLDDFTLSLLTNDEVLAVDQDVMGKQAKQLFTNNNTQVWMKELSDGSKAIGIFNLGEEYKDISVKWSDIGLKSQQKARDLWRQKDLGVIANQFTQKIAPHGVVLIKVQ